MSKLNLLSRIVAATVVGSMCMSTLCSADDAISNTGNELIEYCNSMNYKDNNELWSMCVSYVNGVSAGFLMGVIVTLKLEEPNASNSTILTHNNMIEQHCFPADITRLQMALAVSRYLHEHPENLNDPASFQVFAAFKDTWPCSKSSK